MKAIEEKKIYETPLMEVLMVQNKCVLMAGSFGADVTDRDDNNGEGYEIGS